MKREVKVFLVFLISAAVALTLYGLTSPAGYPWGVKEYWGGTWLCAAVLAGGVGCLVSWYCGWRVGMAVAIAWIFAPGIWNRAILGNALALLFPLVFLALWGAYWLVQDVVRSVGNLGQVGRLGRLSGLIAGWVLLGMSVAFAVYSAYRHDYKLGEAASVYARGIVEDAGDRVIVLNGVVDRQVEALVEDGGERRMVLSPKVEDKLYVLGVQNWVRRTWPTEGDLIVAAGDDLFAFLAEALERHPERFYIMDGSRTTYASWERRWAAFKPYLESSDRFVPFARRLFAYEGNAVANKLQDTDKTAAWKLYFRILEDVNPGNIAALINLNEMLRRGYDATEMEKNSIKEGLAAFLGKEFNRRYIDVIVRASGPIKTAPELQSNVTFDELPTEQQSLIEWHEEMMRAMYAEDFEKAGGIALKILSNPAWRGASPPNAVMGEISANKGDYATSEMYFRMATSNTNVVPDVVWNNFANVLMKRNKLDEAEEILRQGINRCGEDFWPFQYTLAEVLTKKGGSREEVAGLVDVVLRNAPPEFQRELREAQEKGEILK